MFTNSYGGSWYLEQHSSIIISCGILNLINCFRSWFRPISLFDLWQFEVAKTWNCIFLFCRRFMHTFIGRRLTQFSRCLNLAAIVLRDRLRVLGHKSPKKTLLCAFPAPVLMKTFLQLFDKAPSNIFLWEKKQCLIRTDKTNKVTGVFNAKRWHSCHDS